MEKLKEFYLALNRLFQTTDGKVVAETLQSIYVDESAMSAESAELTYYRLGQKEFVQGLLKDADRDIEEIENLTNGQ